MNDLKVAFLPRWITWAAVRVSILKGEGVHDLARWLLAAIPAAAFVLVPAAPILVWLALFWAIELVSFVSLRLVGRRPNRPRLRIRLSWFPSGGYPHPRVGRRLRPVRRAAGRVTVRARRAQGVVASPLSLASLRRPPVASGNRQTPVSRMVWAICRCGRGSR